LADPGQTNRPFLGHGGDNDAAVRLEDPLDRLLRLHLGFQHESNYSYFRFKPLPNESLVSPPFWGGVAEWGVDLVVDNVTNAESGIIRCISNSYVDAGLVRDSLRVLAVSSSDIAAT